ncbi:MAG: GNAT family N-acetyltransferase [Opitutales bacterium]
MNMISTRNLVLRPLEVGHVDAYHQGGAALAEELGVAVPGSWPWSETAEILDWAKAQLEADPEQSGWLIWLILHRGSHLLIGDAGFGGKPNTEGVITLGYNIVPEYRVRGYGSEAAEALVDWAFAHATVKAIEARTPSNHHASMRILEKLGFSRQRNEDKTVLWSRSRPENG